VVYNAVARGLQRIHSHGANLPFYSAVSFMAKKKKSRPRTNRCIL